jgi:hypothetical protein
MIEVYSVKWGDRYSSEWVNKLYSMVSRNIRQEFTFYCLTEDSSGLRSEVNALPLPDDNDLELWWNKMYLFNIDSPNKKIYFDLDVIIQNSIEPILQLDSSEPTFIYSHWKTEFDDRDTLINSSIILWQDAKYIWEHWYNDMDRFMCIYRGIDRYIWNEGIKHNTFPKEVSYSFWKEGAKFNPEKIVAIFNHNPKQDKVNQQWITDYWC